MYSTEPGRTISASEDASIPFEQLVVSNSKEMGPPTNSGTKALVDGIKVARNLVDLSSTTPAY